MSLRHLAAVLAAIGIVIGNVGPAGATVPSTFSYQGVLTDNGGDLVPNGSYNLTFSIYQAASGGSAQWTETQNAVPVNKGGFSVVLGSVTPIGISFDQQLYLGIAVNGGAELAPRVVLTSSPSALALRLPYTGITNGSQTSLSVINSTFGRGLFVESSAYFGNSGYGSVLVGGPGQPFAVARMQSTALGGSYSWYSGVTGSNVGEIFCSPNTNSAMMMLKRVTGGGTSVVLDGDQSGSGDPYFALLGTSRVVAFSPAGVGDNSVFLPSNAISAGEVLDEPGIAQGHNGDYLEISTATTVTDLISVQITTPGSGYIVVEADGMHGLISTGTDMNEAEFTIKDTPGGSLDFGNYYVSGFNNIAPSGLYRTSVSMRRTYFKGPGTYTFYFQARANNPSGTNYIWNPTITATYFPTSYGTVTAIASRAEAARDGLDGAAVSMRRGPGGERVAADAVKVDLSMLELRLAKMREATAQAEAELLRARFARSPEVKDANTSAAEVKQ